MMMNRRQFLINAHAAGLYFSTLTISNKVKAFTSNRGRSLIADPAGILDLPKELSYNVIRTTGMQMSDGFFAPGRPDGMACFTHPTSSEKSILMMNHENWLDTTTGSPFGEGDRLLAKLKPDLLYDMKSDGTPCTGGVTKLVYNMRTHQVENDHLVLTGTSGNCAGGITPWGSWLSCEEAVDRPGEGAEKYHGYIFEVPSDTSGVMRPAPLKAMGRFAHEAAAVDPDTGIVYMTEDNRYGLFYRFIPEKSGQLQLGGRLQALAIKGWPSANTSNWPKDWGGGGTDSIAVNQSYDVEWIDLKNVDDPEIILLEQGYESGAAQFCRGEGMIFGKQKQTEQNSIYFTCTQGGASRSGQIWRLTPGGHQQKTDQLTLIHESTSSDSLDLSDNITIAPWGDLILCEDGPGDQYLRGLTPQGEVYDIARNAHPERSEFCGACFSMDGKILFVNIQEPGITLAITGLSKS